MQAYYALAGFPQRTGQIQTVALNWLRHYSTSRPAHIAPIAVVADMTSSAAVSVSPLGV